MSINDRTISFGNNVLAPVAWTQFAHENPSQAQTSDAPPVDDTNLVMNVLTDINEDVNDKIQPNPDAPGWSIYPREGVCTDYVVTKRYELLRNGFPPSDLLIADVRTPEGEPHAVLVVRTKNADLVLDNRNPMIYPWNDVGYEWVKIQSPENPNYWQSVII